MKPNWESITKSDYDFSGVSQKELEPCLFYEYARESRAVINEVVSVRKQFVSHGGKGGQIKFGPRVQLQVQSHLLMMLASSSGFPTVPWQLLSDRDNQLAVRYFAALPDVWRYSTTWHNPPLTFALNEPGTMTLDFWKKQCRERLPTVPADDPIKSGFFRVNLKYSHTVLIEEFAKYLRHFEGKPMLESPFVTKERVKTKSPGRKGIHDSLNALAALRLRYCCDTFSEAEKKMSAIKDRPHGMYYGRRDNFNRACESAVRRFEKLFGYIDSEKPIHFTKGWQKGTQ